MLDPLIESISKDLTMLYSIIPTSLNQNHQWVICNLTSMTAGMLTNAVRVVRQVLKGTRRLLELEPRRKGSPSLISVLR